MPRWVRRYSCTVAQRGSSRPAKQILAEWHELALRREDATDSDIADSLAARIELLRREYMEGTPPDDAPEAPSTTRDDHEPRIQTKLPF